MHFINPHIYKYIYPKSLSNVTIKFQQMMQLIIYFDSKIQVLIELCIVSMNSDTFIEFTR